MVLTTKEQKQTEKSENAEHEDGKNSGASSEIEPGAPDNEKPPSANDTPEQHDITDKLVEVVLKRFLSEDAEFIIKGYKYRAVANIGEGHTSTRKILEVTFQDWEGGAEKVAPFVVKFPGKCNSSSWDQ